MNGQFTEYQEKLLQNLHKNKIVLISQRLILQQISSDDITGIKSLFSESPSMLFLTDDQKREKAAEWVSKMETSFKKNNPGYFSCFLKNDNTFIGHCGLIKRHFNDEEIFELGYAILRKFWNKGFATEALTTCINFAFNVLKIKHLTAFIEPHNTASILVAQKAGMVFKEDIILENKNFKLYTTSNPEAA